jgi:hypothetical protein
MTATSRRSVWPARRACHSGQVTIATAVAISKVDASRKIVMTAVLDSFCNLRRGRSRGVAQQGQDGDPAAAMPRTADAASIRHRCAAWLCAT